MDAIKVLVVSLLYKDSSPHIRNSPPSGREKNTKFHIRLSYGNAFIWEVQTCYQLIPSFYIYLPSFRESINHIKYFSCFNRNQIERSVYDFKILSNDLQSSNPCAVVLCMWNPTPIQEKKRQQKSFLILLSTLLQRISGSTIFWSDFLMLLRTNPL